MYEVLQQIAADNNWGFTYARRDFQNLHNEVEDTDKIYVFLDPVQVDNNFDEYGGRISQTYSGSFMLLKSSDLGDGYEERYLKDIKPLLQEKIQIVTNAVGCSELTINSWRTTEIINLFDYGFDGIIVNYSVTQ